MKELLDLLSSYRRGESDRAAVLDRFTAAGWDTSDVGLLLDNTAYERSAPQGADFAQQFIDRQAAQRRRQKSPLARR
jgi:hypothetical protein